MTDGRAELAASSMNTRSGAVELETRAAAYLIMRRDETRHTQLLQNKVFTFNVQMCSPHRQNLCLFIQTLFQKSYKNIFLNKRRNAFKERGGKKKSISR